MVASENILHKPEVYESKQIQITSPILHIGSAVSKLNPFEYVTDSKHKRVYLPNQEALARALVSYSGIMGYCSTSRDFITFHPEEFYQLSLSGLSETSAKAISLLNLSDSLEFLGAKFNIINRKDEITSYEELYTNLVANEPESVRRFDLQFITPTAFSQGGVNLPLPVPSVMFSSWLERWNNFAPIYLGGDELIAYLNDAVVIKSHKIQTRSYQLHKGFVNGFVGDLNLQILTRADPLLGNVADLLVQYARFAGTGMKTRLGMGQTIIKLSTFKE